MQPSFLKLRPTSVTFRWTLGLLCGREATGRHNPGGLESLDGLLVVKRGLGRSVTTEEALPLKGHLRVLKLLAPLGGNLSI